MVTWDKEGSRLKTQHIFGPTTDHVLQVVGEEHIVSSLCTSSLRPLTLPLPLFKLHVVLRRSNELDFGELVLLPFGVETSQMELCSPTASHCEFMSGA